MAIPRGIRNNNPGNIRHSDQWKGLTPEQPDPDFCTFSTPEYGIRAMGVILLNYQRKHGLKTIRHHHALGPTFRERHRRLRHARGRQAWRATRRSSGRGTCAACTGGLHHQARERPAPLRLRDGGPGLRHGPRAGVMGWLDMLTGGLAGRVVDRVADMLPNRRAERQQEHERLMGQQATNTAEVQSSQGGVIGFVRSWRSVVGLLCGVALAWQVIVRPILVALFPSVGWFGYASDDMTLIGRILLGMLGLGI